MAELNLSDKARDKFADVVIGRLRRADERRRSNNVYQGHSTDYLIRRAEAQYKREYLPGDASKMKDAFGFTPTRYYGVTNQKTNATWNWKLDLVINSLDSIFTVNCTPEPDLDKPTLDRIREQVRFRLRQKLTESGVADPELLLNADRTVNDRIKGFIEAQAQAFKDIEQSQIVSVASQGAKRAATAMRDVLVEGNFRQAYGPYSFDQILYGAGVMRAPYYKMMPVVRHSGKNGITRTFESKPTFKHVDIHNFYPIDDADSVLCNTGNTEVTQITKTQLIACAKDKNYDRSAIAEIIEDFDTEPRGWVYPRPHEDGEILRWEPDESIDLIIHEGYFSGDELAEMGVTGVDSLDYASARVEVCGYRTIRCSVIKEPQGEGRTYFMAPFNKTSDSINAYVGMGAMLWDSEQRVNRIMHIFEHNLEWSAMDTKLVNPHAFENPNDAWNLMPGQGYRVDDRYGTTGSMPEPVRRIATVSAQYHLIMTQVSAILRQADEDCGIPAFAYGSQDFGRSSLGEYSQRLSNALRTVKGLAFQEDFYFIEPAFTGEFYRLLDSNKELRVGQDINIVVRGMTGLLAEDVKAQKQDQVIPAIGALAQYGAQVPPQVPQYALYNLLSQAGYPVDALGLSNPEIDQALAVAAGLPTQGLTPGGPQVPALDGRSAAAVGNVASPDGVSNLNQIGPIQ